MRMHNPKMRMLAVMLAASSHATIAQAKTEKALYVTASGSVSANPNLQTSDQGAALGASLSISPVLRIVEPRESFSLRGNATFSEYSRGYRPDQRLSLSSRYNRAMSERVTFSSSLNFQTSRSNPYAYNRNLPIDAIGEDAVDGDGNPLDDDFDLSSADLADLTRRSYELRGDVGFGVAISERDSLGFGLNVRGRRFEGDAVGRRELNQAGADLSWSRRLSERTTGGIAVQARKIEYIDIDLGDGETYTPTVFVNHRITQLLRVSASAGVFVARQTGFDGEKRSNVGFAGQANACRTIRGGNVCLDIARDQQPTSMDGITTRFSAGASLSQRIGPDGRMLLSADYTKQDRNSALVGSVQREYMQARARYSHRISRMLSVVGSVFYRDFYQTESRPSNYGASLGVTLALDDR